MPGNGAPPEWSREGWDWPNREAGRFVRAAGLVWHVQVAGDGPVLLLVHGTGASTHSWRDLLPLLAKCFTVVAPDLPGHGFTTAPPPSRQSLPNMARALAELLRVLQLAPAGAVGHSAGAAVALRMCLDDAMAPGAVVALNGAIMPLEGVRGGLFAPVAKFLALTPLAPRLFAWRARDPKVVRDLLGNTGSAIDERGVDLYARLVRRPRHAAAALAMMANWDLDPLLRDLPRLKPALTLVVGDKDGLIPPKDADRVAGVVPGAEVVSMPGLGHLAHEERPGEVADLIVGRAEAAGILRVGDDEGAGLLPHGR